MKLKAFYKQDGQFADGRDRFLFWTVNAEQSEAINMAELDARKKLYDCWPIEA